MLMLKRASEMNLLYVVLAENFRNYGLSELAFTPFGTDFSVDDAIGLLLAEYKSNQYHLITCLISLYCEKKDYVKAAYLYVIFQSKVKMDIHAYMLKYVEKHPLFWVN